MNFTIACGMFARMANAAKSVQDYPKGYEGILLEHRSGQTFIVASNVKVLAAQLIGKTNEPDGSVLLAYDQKLIDQCETESRYDGQLSVIAEPMLSFVSLKTTMGYLHPGNIGLFAERHTDWNNWRDHLPADNDEKNHGLKYFASDTLIQLAQSAPSGALLFPENISNEQPVVIADTNDPTWIGVCFPWTSKPIKTKVKIPVWAK